MENSYVHIHADYWYEAEGKTKFIFLHTTTLAQGDKHDRVSSVTTAVSVCHKFFILIFPAT